MVDETHGTKPLWYVSMSRITVPDDILLDNAIIGGYNTTWATTKFDDTVPPWWYYDIHRPHDDPRVWFGSMADQRIIDDTTSDLTYVVKCTG